MKKITLSTMILSLEFSQVLLKCPKPFQQILSTIQEQDLETILTNLNEIEIENNSFFNEKILETLNFETKNQKKLINELNQKKIYLLVRKKELSLYERISFFLTKKAKMINIFIKEFFLTKNFLTEDQHKEIYNELFNKKDELERYSKEKKFKEELLQVKEIMPKEVLQLLSITSRDQAADNLVTRVRRWLTILLYTRDDLEYCGDPNVRITIEQKKIEDIKNKKRKERVEELKKEKKKNRNKEKIEEDLYKDKDFLLEEENLYKDFLLEKEDLYEEDLYSKTTLKLADDFYQEKLYEKALEAEVRENNYRSWFNRTQKEYDPLLYVDFDVDESEFIMERLGFRSNQLEMLLRPFYATIDNYNSPDELEYVSYDGEFQHALIFHSDNYYYPENNEGGFKSICPVFFDFQTAEGFMYHAIETSLNFLEDMTAKGKYFPPTMILNRKYLARLIFWDIFESQIMSMGLGDFIRYYSQFDLQPKFDYSLVIKKNNPLNKIEFLFFPHVKELMELEKKNRMKHFLKKIFFFLPERILKKLRIKQPLSFNDYKKIYFSLNDDT
jgi:hypothetical protein